MPDRTTPANDMLAVGEEYKIELGPESELEIITSLGTYSSELAGSVGYSFCPEGSDSVPCPFYVGSFEATTTTPISASIRCEDGTTAEAEIANVFMRLSQPAFGIARASSLEKGFPRGGLIFETELDVGAVHIAKRRPTTADVVLNAKETMFDASNLIVSMTVPCNTSSASVTARLTVRDRGDGSALGRPPEVTNTTATTDACGRPRTLSATVSDPDGDAGSVRWRVDGVLMAPGTSSMIVTGAHTLEAIVRDSRGATTPARKALTCF